MTLELVVPANTNNRSRESLVNTFGSTLRATTPGTVEPPPVFSVRLANRADLAATIAAERRGSGKGLIARIIWFWVGSCGRISQSALHSYRRPGSSGWLGRRRGGLARPVGTPGRVA